MKRINILILLLVLQLMAVAQVVSDSTRHEVLLETNRGHIRLVLYDETPLHRDNFLSLVRKGYYDGTLFHRVIENFMIQGGDSTTRHAQPDAVVGTYSPNYRIPAEIVFPKYFHHRGVLAAAREGDADNPERASSSSQFYIVWGKRMTDFQQDQVQARLDLTTNGSVQLTPEIRSTYFKKGGTPHLDGQYTVFGEVVEGLEVVADIQKVETNDRSRPLQDVRIIKATVLK
ncbi:MAG: peptidylprolyl isomerase [Prevotellaceae bacterium]|nr:peptidylprolyl isomerase [Prevotellaceae bacterium]MDY3365694.1 peptidylprolyl isomerase [Prevotella sp.]